MDEVMTVAIRNLHESHPDEVPLVSAQEMREILANPRTRRALEQADKIIEKRDFVPLDEVMEDLQGRSQ